MQSQHLANSGIGRNVIASSLAYLAEHEAQPEAFGTIPHAMWWAIVTLTTVGYGDAVPITPWGKVVGGLIGIIGIGMVALPAGLLASGFSEQLHQRRREFEAAVDQILTDGIITAEEGRRLRELRDRLGLSDHQAAEIARLIGRERRAAHCPHCGQALGPTPAPPRGRCRPRRTRRRLPETETGDPAPGCHGQP